MNSVLTRIRWGTALGVYLNGEVITLTEVATTLLGTVVVATHTQRVGEEGSGAALKGMIQARLTPRRRRHTQVCLGVGPERTLFFTALAGEGQHKEGPSAQSLLAAKGMAPSSEADEFVADKVPVKFHGQQAYSVAACRKQLAEELHSALKEAGVANYRLEPAPWALSHAAERHGRTPRKWKTVIRVLLAKTGGLALLVCEDQAVLWRRFNLSQGEEAVRVASAARSLQVHAMQSLGVRDVNGVVLQGFVPDGLVEQVGEYLGIPVMSAGCDSRKQSSGEALDDEMYSESLAFSAKRERIDSMDLLRSMRPPPSLREIMPWKLAGLVLLLTGCMAFMLWDKSSSLEGECESLRRQNASRGWAAKLTTQAINKEQSALAAETTAVFKFLSTRIIWSDYLRDLPTRLPGNACLSDVSAANEMKEMSKKKVQRKINRSLTLRGMTRFSDRGTAPREIDAFLESLRSVDLLKRDFPLVELAEIKWRRDGNSEVALFTIIAMPKDKSKDDSAEEEGGGHDRKQKK